MSRAERVIAGYLIALGTLLTVAAGVWLFLGIEAEGCQYMEPGTCGGGSVLKWAWVFLLPVLVGGLWIAWRVGSGRPLRRRPRLLSEPIAAAIYPPQRPPRPPAVPRPSSSTRPAVFVACPTCGRQVNAEVGRCPYCRTAVEGGG